MDVADWPDALELGPVTVLTGIERGRYPHGNSVLVQGVHDTVLLDPSLTVAELGPPRGVDHVMLSHVHEDHVPGLSRLPDVPVHAHTEDALGLRSVDGLMEIFGLDEEGTAAMRPKVIEEFHYRARPDVETFSDGDTFDLGGVTVEVVHTPGHTRGHCALRIPEASVAYIGDIDLTGFGPYYGDAWSDLDDFEASLDRCRDLDVDHIVTFHHKWVISGRDEIAARLDEYAAVITRREEAMVEYLAEPRTLEDLIEHRFVFRPHVDLPYVHSAEKRNAEQHLARLTASGRVEAVGDDAWVATGAR